MKILFTGGGTMGHIYPIVSIAREIERLYPETVRKTPLELHYLGPKDELGFALLSYEEIKITNIISGKVRRYFSWENIIDILFKIPFGILQSIFYLILISPNLVFSKGGSGSFSVTIAARILGIPIFIHESDVVPGLSNQKTSKWAKKIFTSFPKTEYFNPLKVTQTGNPIREDLLDGNKTKAGEIFNLSLTRPIILITGGSQGAEAINDFTLLVLNSLLKNYEIIHVTGPANIDQITAESQAIALKDFQKYYHVFGILNEEKLKHAYQAADLIVSRSGSGSIFEIAAVGKPSILIPLPSSAGNHQAKNAYTYAQNGSAMVIEQENLTQNFFLENLQILFTDKDKLLQMSQSALAFSKPLAARAIAREILEFLMLE
jgi:UDP-N-acetylglucosamine--N-acetylmuramyl-(pentapeptide) pyrophosphoryl-undecaprenol N-acetylglucosamine transferase